MQKEWLHEKYVLDGLSMAKIAVLAKCSAPTIQNYLKKFGIASRSISQALIGRKLSTEHRDKVIVNINAYKQKRHEEGVSKQERIRLSLIRPDRTGMKHSEATKAKMRQKAIGRKMSPAAKDKISRYMIGRRLGTKHPLYGKTREDIKGEKHPNWQGGVSYKNRIFRQSTKYAEWRKGIFERDKYTCQACGSHGSNTFLNADHVKPFALILREYNISTIEQLYACEELWNLENGRTLCVACHEQTPTYKGGTLRLIKELSARKD